MKFNEVFTEKKYNDHLLGLKTNFKEGKKLNLSEANLNCANLSKADLKFISCGNNIEIKTIKLENYQVVICKNINIICITFTTYTYNEWRNFTNIEISEIDFAAREFSNKWKNIIFDIYEKIDNLV
jgi:uncharacterized protein YjbI with pentapeptide repeats